MIRQLLDSENFTAAKLSWHQSIARDPRLSLQAKAVAGFILHDLNAQEGCAWRGQEAIASALGISVRQLRRIADELSTAGYLQIEVRRGRGRTNLWRANLPAEPASNNRSSATVRRPEKGTAEALQITKNRSPEAEKPDASSRQYLEESFKKISARQVPREVGGGLPPRFEQAEIRALVAHAGGEAAAVSYLDTARWDVRQRLIICRTETGFERLLAIAGGLLKERGISVLHARMKVPSKAA